MTKCKACTDHTYLDIMAENFLKADRMATDGINPEITDSLKWTEVDKMEKLCAIHKTEFLNDYDL